MHTGKTSFTYFALGVIDQIDCAIQIHFYYSEIDGWPLHPTRKKEGLKKLRGCRVSSTSSKSKCSVGRTIGRTMLDSIVSISDFIKVSHKPF